MLCRTSHISLSFAAEHTLCAILQRESLYDTLNRMHTHRHSHIHSHSHATAKGWLRGVLGVFGEWVRRTKTRAKCEWTWYCQCEFVNDVCKKGISQVELCGLGMQKAAVLHCTWMTTMIYTISLCTDVCAMEMRCYRVAIVKQVSHTHLESTPKTSILNWNIYVTHTHTRPHTFSIVTRRALWGRNPHTTQHTDGNQHAFVLFDLDS